MHDGPGIRTTAFFKGCPLSCWWCHNPESRSPEPETSVRNNPVDGISFPSEERIGTFYTVETLTEELVRDRIFFEESGGGVTLSGGEPLMQPEFTCELLESLKKQGIHTAIDTCGQVRQEELEKTLPFTDFYLYDLKLMDEADHITYTGVSNRLIHDNLLFLVRSGKQVVIRFPVIPGITDTPKNTDLLKEFLMRLQPGVSVIHLLPYHSMAKPKYMRFNLENRMNRISEPKTGDLDRLKVSLEEIGLKVITGG